MFEKWKSAVDKSTNCEKLLGGIKVDSRLNLHEHVDGITVIKKASRNVNAIISENTIHEHKQKAHTYGLIFQLTI